MSKGEVGAFDSGGGRESVNQTEACELIHTLHESIHTHDFKGKTHNRSKIMPKLNSTHHTIVK